MATSAQYYDIPGERLSIAPKEGFEELIKDFPQEMKDDFRQSYRGAQLVEVVMEVILEGGDTDNDDHLLNTLLSEIPVKLEQKGIRLIDKMDLVYCLIELRKRGWIREAGFCYVPGRGEITVYISPSEAQARVHQSAQLVNRPQGKNE